MRVEEILKKLECCDWSLPLFQNVISRDKFKESLRNQIEVIPAKHINGYYVKTLARSVCGEIIISFITVFENEESTEMVQCNIDYENLFGTLLASDCYEPYSSEEDIDQLADAYFKEVKKALRRR